MDALFLVNGKHNRRHMYRVGDNATIDCQIIAMPLPSVTWSYRQQIITTTARTTVCFMRALYFINRNVYY